MPFTEWQRGQQVLAGVESHWFDLGLDVQSGEVLVTAAYTGQYGSGTAPWTATVTTIRIDASGNAAASPLPVATYQTGFDFQTSDTGLTSNETAILWTSANGTYPASSAVDLNMRAIDAAGHPVGPAVTLLSDVNDLYQFRVASSAFGGASVVVAYSTFDAATQVEQVHYAVFGANGAPMAGESGVLDSFTSPGYDSFGFGTLTTSTGQNPGFFELRAVANSGSPSLGYQTISTSGVMGAFTTINLNYAAGSTGRVLKNWVWDRLDPPSGGGNNLVTVSMLSDVVAGGAPEQSIDVRIQNTAGGPASDDVIALNSTSTNLAVTRLASGGFVIGYTDLGMAYLRDYDNAGDVIGLGSYTLPQDPTSFKIETMPDGRLVVAYAVNGGSSLAYDIFSLPTGPIAYDVDSGIVRKGLVLGSNDQLTVEAGGTAVGTVVTSKSGAVVTVKAGGTTSGTVLNSNLEYVLAGGTTTGTIVNGPAQQLVVMGGLAIGTIVNLNGVQDTGGSTRNTIINNGGYQFTGQTARDYGATLNAGSNQWLSGEAFNTLIQGGSQLVEATAIASNAVVTSGNQDVISGGAAVGTTVNGGFQYVESGGLATRSTVSKGGTIAVSAGGFLQGLVLNAGGTLQLRGDGSSITESGYAVFTDNGGTIVKTTGSGLTKLTATLANTGSVASVVEAASGTLEVAGRVTGAFALKADAGATLILDSPTAAGATVSFGSAGGTLRLNDAPDFQGQIAGFGAGEAIDLRLILDGSGHTPTLSYKANGGTGTLAVSDGTHAASLTMLGTYTQTAFHLATDSHGGTLVTYG